ncbi:MAG: hypothetical protein J6Y94_06845 [Bacteriovoracaceae bacterium]|nr:hypothetical protein [Bacteriovoracaceae bacterium]
MMRPLLFMERLVLESLVRQTKSEGALAEDTAMEKEVLNYLLASLAKRGLIERDARGIHVDVTMREKLIKLLTDPGQQQSEVQDVLLQLGQRHLQGKLSRAVWHLRKAYLPPAKVVYLGQLLQRIKEVFDEAALSDTPHALHEEYVFTWAAAQCSALMQEVMRPLGQEDD